MGQEGIRRNGSAWNGMGQRLESMKRNDTDGTERDGKHDKTARKRTRRDGTIKKQNGTKKNRTKRKEMAGP